MNHHIFGSRARPFSSSTVLHTFVAISSVLVYVGDPRVSAGSSSPVSRPQNTYSSFSRSSSNRQSRSIDISSRTSAVVLQRGSTSSGRMGNHHEPYFAEGSSGETRNMSAQLGTTTYLHCKVNSLGGKTVSWLKRYGDTSHLLTFGQSTYSNDARFQIYHEEASNDWRLQIQFPRMEDEGIYECLVSTDPPLTRRFRLFVIAPEIHIVDERDKAVLEKFYKGGSTIELKCIVKKIVGQPPEYIIWHHEDRMLNYDTERGGISVKTDLSTDGAVSRLFIAFASKRDSGNYTCGMRNAQASVTVHILNGENPAAMQTGTSHRQSPSPVLWILFMLISIQKCLQRTH